MITLSTLPLTIGVTWDARKSARFNTVTQYPVSGARPVSFSDSPYPSWEWELVWEVIRDQGLDEINQTSPTMKPDFNVIQDFYLTMNGSNGRFVYDPAANVIPLEDTFVTEDLDGTLVNGYSGLTDGTTTAFQLYRSSAVNGYTEQVEAIDALSAISAPSGSNPFALYLNGTLVSSADYALSQYPLMVTFSSAPASDESLSWSGNYAYVAKFQEDRLDLNQFMSQLWELQSLRLEQVALGF